MTSSDYRWDPVASSDAEQAFERASRFVRSVEKWIRSRDDGRTHDRAVFAYVARLSDGLAELVEDTAERGGVREDDPGRSARWTADDEIPAGR